MYKRAALLFTAIIISSTSTVSILASPVQAAGGLYIDPLLKQSAVMNTKRNELALCLSFGLTKNSITMEEVTSWKWFETRTGSRTIDWLSPTNEVVCNTHDVKKLVNDLGFTQDPITVACKLGAERTEANNTNKVRNDCLNGAPDDRFQFPNRRAGKQAALSHIDQVYQGVAGFKQYSAEQYYAMAASLFTDGGICKATPVTANDPTTQQTVSKVPVKVVDESGAVTTVNYHIGGDTNKKWSFRQEEDSSSDDGSEKRVETCDGLVKIMADNAAAYGNWIKTNPPGSPFRAGTCAEHAAYLKSQGGRTRAIDEQTIEKACTGGVAHKTDQTYCDDTYNIKSRPDENAACRYGQTASKESLAQTDDPNKAQLTCNITGVGWLICPVFNFMAWVIDQSYSLISAMLTVSPSMFKQGDTNQKVLYESWANMRTVANILFVVVFLIIIYSQVTGAGISNYGIKRMLPRLIISAILVNISFLLCALAVDVSNLLGQSMKAFIENSGGVSIQKVSFANGASTFGAITGAVLGSAAVAAVGISALLPALVSALLVIVVVLLTLTLRQALVILLVIVSPLAFVAFLLPNTEKWFNKWREAFTAMLLLYPIIGVLFGASNLASKIIMNTAGNNIALQIMGALISILPLAMVPTLMKTSSGLLNRFAGYVNNPNKGPFDRMRRGAEAIKKDSLANTQTKRLRRWKSRNDTGVGGIRKTFRSVSGAGSAAKMNLRARSEKTNAALESAEAGYMMDNPDAREATKLRMATAAAKSAQQSASLRGLDAESQRKAVGLSQEGENSYFDSALRTQINAAEKQAIQDVEATLSPKTADEIGVTLREAIVAGDRITALAAQNKLSSMGNKGVDVMQESITNGEKIISKSTDNEKKTQWNATRLELARNLDGGVMQKSEVLKTWANNTQIDKNGNLIKGGLKSMDQIEIEQTSPGGSSDLSIEKFMNQTPKMQNKLITNDAVSQTVLEGAVSELNNKSLDGGVRTNIENKLASLRTSSPPISTPPASPTTSTQSSSNPQTQPQPQPAQTPPQTNTQSTGTPIQILNFKPVPTMTPPPSTSTPPAGSTQSSPSTSAPTEPTQKNDTTTHLGKTYEKSDSGLYIPRDMNKGN